MGHRMTERDAIVLAAVLGAVVLVMVLIVCRPFTWGSETEVAVTGGAANASGAGVSGQAVAGDNVSGTAVIAGGGEIMNEAGTTLQTRVNPPEG